MSRILDLCAIDAGQSNTRYLVFDKGREILSEDTGQGVTNILLSGAKEALRKNLDIIMQKTRRTLGSDRFRVISVGYTGISREREEFKVVLAILKGIFQGSKITLESDIITSHAANFQGKPGIVLHAGTGAFAYGVDSSGKSMRTGGWGYLLGDEGSGFGLGLQAIRAALGAWEKTGPQTGLKDELLPFFEIDDPQTLKTVVYSESFQRRRIAEFSRILLEHADRGDPVARKILSAGASEMVKLIEPIMMDLHFEHPEAALTGALFTNNRSYFEKTRSLLRAKYGKGLGVRPGEKSTLYGALWIGLDALGADNRSR
jgi:N-acetylglucosamine kinase-like BadF-type ATPase